MLSAAEHRSHSEKTRTYAIGGIANLALDPATLALMSADSSGVRKVLLSAAADNQPAEVRQAAVFALSLFASNSQLRPHFEPAGAQPSPVSRSIIERRRQREEEERHRRDEQEEGAKSSSIQRRDANGRRRGSRQMPPPPVQQGYKSPRESREGMLGNARDSRRELDGAFSGLSSLPAPTPRGVEKRPSGESE